jgi:hypothetical protein
MNLNKIALVTGLAVSGITVSSVFTSANAVNIIDSTYGVGAGSFELGNFINGGGTPPTGQDFMGLAPGSTTITGWTVGGPNDGIDWITPPTFGVNTGIYAVDLQHLAASSISTSIPTIIGNVYELSFATATIIGRTAQGSVSVGSLANQPFTATYSSAPSNQTYTPFTFLFTATGSTTQVTFTSTGFNTNYGPVIDSVSVDAVSTATVPEPSSILGLGTIAGLGLIGGLKRKLSKK